MPIKIHAFMVRLRFLVIVSHAIEVRCFSRASHAYLKDTKRTSHPASTEMSTKRISYPGDHSKSPVFLGSPQYPYFGRSLSFLMTILTLFPNSYNKCDRYYRSRVIHNQDQEICSIKITGFHLLPALVSS